MKGLTGNLMFAIVAVAFGSGWQHGYTTAVMNAPAKVIQAWMLLTPNGIGLSTEKLNSIFGTMNGCYAIGGIIGGLVSGVMAQYLGRKWTLILNNILVFIPGIIEFLLLKINYFEVLILCRFLLGINNGINAGVVPMFCVELSPPNLRGAMGSAYQLVIVISILIAQVLGTEKVLGSEDLWPVLLGITIIPGIIQVITLVFCHDSPKYLLLIKGNEEGATKALRWLRKDESEIADELAEMKAEEAEMASREKLKCADYMNKNYLRMPLFISLVLMMGQQFSGINAIMFYSTSILDKQPVKGQAVVDSVAISAQNCTIIIGVVNLVTTLVQIYLVEMVGRKTLLLIAFGGMTLVTSSVCIVLIQSEFKGQTVIALTLICVYVVLFAIGAGAIPWFMVSELFKQEARGLPVAVSCALNWACSAIVGFTFPVLMASVQNHVFWFYVAATFLVFIFVIFLVPETKGKTTDEVLARYR